MRRLLTVFLFILGAGLFVWTYHRFSMKNDTDIAMDIALEIPDILPSPKKYLVVIPGYGGNENRKSKLRDSLVLYPSADWDCLLFVYNAKTEVLPSGLI